MTILNIILHPDSILYTPTEALSLPELNSSHIQSLIEDMIDTCIAADGLGLAANQVGIGKSLFVIRKGGTNQFDVIVNPRIIAKSSRVTNYGEACLSIPEKSFNVKRYKSVKIEYLDRSGEMIIAKSRNKREAFCFQHEIDHLNGITLITK